MGNGASGSKEKYLIDELAKAHEERDQLAEALRGTLGATDGVLAKKTRKSVTMDEQTASATTDAEYSTMDALLAHTKDAISSWQPSETVVDMRTYFARALATFETDHEGEMNFSEGEIMVVLGEIEGGWLEAALGDETGYVPETWVARAMLQPATYAPEESPGTDPPSTGRQLEIGKGDVVGVIGETTTDDGKAWTLVVLSPADFVPAGFEIHASVGPGYIPSGWLKLARSAVATEVSVLPMCQTNNQHRPCSC